jgi:hypothetical protein
MLSQSTKFLLFLPKMLIEYLIKRYVESAELFCATFLSSKQIFLITHLIPKVEVP